MRASVLILLGVLGVSLALRIAALLSLANTPYFNVALPDESLYHAWASQIAGGTYKPSLAYQFSPLPAYLLAFLYTLFSPDLLYFRILNVLLGVATCYFIYLIGNELAGRWVGLISCLIAAMYEPFIFYSIVPLKTALSVFLFAATIYGFLAVLNRPSLAKKLMLGFVTGLLLNVRENALVLIPLLPLMILWSDYRAKSSIRQLAATLLMYVLGLALTTGPFVIRNHLLSGNIVLSTHQSGFNLYLGNNLENPDPYYRPVPFASPRPSEQGVQFTIEASRRAGRTLSSAEASSYWTREVAKMAVAEPARFMWKIWQKTLIVFSQFEAGDHYSIEFISRVVPFFRFPFLTLALILPFGVAGMATTLHGSRVRRYACLTAIAYAGTLILFFTNTRYRLPLVTLFIPFAVLGIDQLRALMNQRRLRAIGLYAVVLIICIVIEYLPVQATDDMTAYYNTHALVLDRSGIEKEALNYWETSSSMNRPFSVYANLSLAQKHLSKNEFEKANAYLAKIPESSFAAAQKYEVMGDSLVRQGRASEAAEAYERSLDINSGRISVRSKLVRVLSQVNRERAQQEFERLKEVSSYYQGL